MIIRDAPTSDIPSPQALMEPKKTRASADVLNRSIEDSLTSLSESPVNPATMSGFLLSSSSESRIRRGPADGTSCAGGTKRATGTFLATCSSSKSITAVADWSPLYSVVWFFSNSRNL
nr:hypothetical protein Iba_scaffold13899CG0010 [Ipomoea batatas]